MTIKEARHKTGLSQAKMSEMLLIPRRTIEEWETDKRKPPKWAEMLVVEKLLQIAAAQND